MLIFELVRTVFSLEVPKPLRLGFCRPPKFNSPGDRMYRNTNRQQLEFPDFYLPFSGHLDPKNRWVALARLIPWELAEAIYHADLCQDSGQPIVPARVALGALLIKERQGLTDRETVETIAENPYTQFFLGLEEFTQEPPFDASLMVDFRKRFGEDGMQRLSEAIALASLKESEPKIETDSKPEDDSEPPANDGQLIADATCAPADIRYPTDVSLLNEAREKTEAIIRSDHRRTARTVGRQNTTPADVSRQSASTLCCLHQAQKAWTQEDSPGKKRTIGVFAS